MTNDIGATIVKVPCPIAESLVLSQEKPPIASFRPQARSLCVPNLVLLKPLWTWAAHVVPLRMVRFSFPMVRFCFP